MIFYEETNFKETSIGKIPKEWEVVALNDVCMKIKAGGTPLTSKREYYDGNIPFVKIEDLTNSPKYLKSTSTTITKTGLENSSAWLVPAKSLLFAMYGSIGAMAINEVQVATNQAILAIIPNREKTSVEFLFYLLTYLKPHLERHAKQTTQANLTAEIVKNFRAWLPEPLDQQKIAEILSTLDEAIHRTDEVIAKTERLKKGLMQELLTKGTGHRQFKNTEIGIVPKERKVVSLEEVVTSYKNGIYKPNEYYGRGYPCIRMYNIAGGHINLDNAVLLDVTDQELEEYGLEPGDVVVNRVNTPELVGKAGVVPQNLGKTTFESKNIRIRLDKSKISPEFFSVFVQTAIYSRQVLSKAKTAVAQATITQDDLGSLKIPLPPPAEQQKIAEVISGFDRKLELERRQKMMLGKIKSGLMDLLLTGKVRVKVIA